MFSCGFLKETVMKEVMTSFNICTKFHSDHRLATFNSSWVNDILLIHLRYDILGPDYFLQVLFGRHIYAVKDKVSSISTFVHEDSIDCEQADQISNSLDIPKYAANDIVSYLYCLHSLRLDIRKDVAVR